MRNPETGLIASFISENGMEVVDLLTSVRHYLAIEAKAIGKDVHDYAQAEWERSEFYYDEDVDKELSTFIFVYKPDGAERNGTIEFRAKDEEAAYAEFWHWAVPHIVADPQEDTIISVELKEAPGMEVIVVKCDETGLWDIYNEAGHCVEMDFLGRQAAIDYITDNGLVLVDAFHLKEGA